MKLSAQKVTFSNSLKKHTVTIDFSENCNIHCLNCPRSVRLKNWDINNYWKLDEAKKLIDYIMKELEPSNIDIGVLAEFCIYKYNAEILEYMYTNYPDVQILITTNLTNLSDKLLESIRASKNVTVNCSLWTNLPDMYLRLHGEDFFERVDVNLQKLLSVENKQFDIMISTIEYNKKQLDNMREYTKNLSQKYNMKYCELTGSRRHEPNTLTLYRNVYMPDLNNIPADFERKFDSISEVNNSSCKINWTCDMIRNNAYFTYNRCYACVNMVDGFNFTLNNLDDLSYKLNKQLALENKMDICKTCSIGYCCMGKGH